MQDTAADIKILKKLAKKYNFEVPDIEANYKTVPSEVLAEIEQELKTVKPRRFTHTFDFGQKDNSKPTCGRIRIKLAAEMFWSEDGPIVEFEFQSVTLTNIPKPFNVFFSDVLSEALQNSSDLWNQIENILLRRADVKQFQKEIDRIAKKLEEIEYKYPGFAVDDWFTDFPLKHIDD